MLTPMEVTESTNPARLRRAVGWFGVAFFAALALVASVYLLFDAWRVATHISSLASVRVALVAAVVILAAVVLVAVFTWLAGRSARGATIATVAALVALVLVRVVIAVAYDGVLSGEPGIYTRLAANMAAGDCCLWDTAIDRPPGYVFILAAAFAVGGQTPAVAEGLNIVMALASGLFVLALARHLYGPRVGAVALLLYALWPAGALMITAALPHTAYELAIAAGAWAVVTRPRGWKGSALGGGILGLSQYLRPTTMLLLPVFIVARLWASGRWQGFITGTLIPMSLAFLLVLLPIAAWNLSTRGVIDISTSAYSGSTLYHGTNVDSGGAWSRQAADELAAAGGDDAWDRSAAGMRLAIDRALDDPLAIAALAIRKQTRLVGSRGLRRALRDPQGSRQPPVPAQVGAAVAGQRHLLCGAPGADGPGAVASTPGDRWPCRPAHWHRRDAGLDARIGRGARPLSLVPHPVADAHRRRGACGPGRPPETPTFRGATGPIGSMDTIRRAQPCREERVRR